MSRLTLCFSMYSDMSICTRAFSSPNMNWASRLASNVLPTPVGPAKMKLPIGRFGILHAGPALADRLGDGADRFVLADDGLVQLVFHRQQPFGFVGVDARQRHAGHLVDDLADHFLIDDAVDFLGSSHAIRG